MTRSIQPGRAPCPCGLDAAYADCCGRFHQGKATAATATATAFHTDGTIEFRATYVIDRTPGEHHKSSTFIRESGEWVYVSGR